MYLLDTCTISDYLRGDALIEHRINLTPKSDIWTSVVNVHEVLNGATAQINAEKNPQKLSYLFGRLLILVREINKYQVLDFDATAQSYLPSFQSAPRQISLNDKLIAAIAKANNKIVVTSNLQHFRHLLPEGQLQDWSRPE